MYPDSEYAVEELTDPTTPSGPGEADQVYLITPKNGGPEEPILVEAKGVNADLGSKLVRDKRVQQGTREYVEDLAENEPSAKVSDAIDKALRDGTLKYVVIRPTVDSSGRWTGSVVQQFNIDKYGGTNEYNRAARIRS
ncbi:hypothetical protein [Williamsia sp. CHRR-6]|uniref:hypothetical protein n=1 Tax=Williamsia sp. CHRR-6 TaxID=2835871 RepID=UPI001BDB4017|nr:hypothetical protein [Williamsia sp. CHRR-6]MBT0566092.1 hypothetical protein [Williamsia sp. CHRR-6]